MPHSDPTLGSRPVAADNNASIALHPAIRVVDAQPAAHEQRVGTGPSCSVSGRHSQAGESRHIHFASPIEDAPVESFETVPLPVDPDYPVLLTVPGLERYQLVKKIGEGAFSQVYHAIDLMSREHVAIKVIEKSHLNSIQRASVQKEASIHARLHHPNVIALRQHFETERNYVFVLELATGGELFHRIVELTYFSEDLARHVIVQVAKGIHYLHHQVGVVHRDIKPENLLFTPIPFSKPRKTVPTGRAQGEEKLDEGPFVPGVGGGGIGQVKIADFGLSKVVWTDGTKTPCGTAGYTAPETIQGQSYTQSVDLWALGCVLYTCLCGFPPFHDEDQIVLTQKVARGEWTFLQPWWNNISPSAKHLVSRLLEIRPERRYTIDQFFSHPWCVYTVPWLHDK
ncbi:kinase-like domain-containing protein [Catenaria anguillulae PL171]|uniref:Kinase-like domain-containing protein n=1 Tax=Catenaria anguillulae PL171 TaxID=765915 RepID=A0A1Y2HWB1_9FUNG|nr:kinase-like domain-containing protein [Catenaria anguillulae PL171]